MSSKKMIQQGIDTLNETIDLDLVETAKAIAAKLYHQGVNITAIKHGEKGVKRQAAKGAGQ